MEKMKKALLLLSMLVIVSIAFSQKKGKVDPKDVKIDSLTKVTSSLSMQLDSVSKDRDVYYGLYTVIKEKVIKYDFDPSKGEFLIDSLKTTRDSTMLGLATSAETLSSLKMENKKLNATIDSLNAANQDNTKLVTELKQLKELLDAKIITQADFDAKKTVIMEQWK
jgi:hypothetical protein